jgi:hypothetical protein
MPNLKAIVQRVPFFGNADFLVSIGFILAGALIAREGGMKLWELWTKLSAHMPISLQENVGDRIVSYLPMISGIFISSISSVCAVVIGILWSFSGISDVLQSRRTSTLPSGFANPDLPAESLRSSIPRHWRSRPWLLGLLALIWPRARFMTPVSYELFWDLVRSLFKILLLTILVAVAMHLLLILPSLSEKYLHFSFTLVVPSPKPLYLILGLTALVNSLIAITLVPIRRRSFDRGRDELAVVGKGDPHLFVALLEEGCRLLNPKGCPDRPATRLEEEANPDSKASLMESFPTKLPSLSRPAGYLCLPLIVLLLVLGFSRLIQFQGIEEAMPYADFLSFHLVDYVLEVTVAFGLILCGLHFSEWARSLLGVCKFRSALIFCREIDDVHSEETNDRPARKRSIISRSGSPATKIWRSAQGVDDRFVEWAKYPDSIRKFMMEICWAEAVSESGSPEGPRHLTLLQQSPALDGAMNRILRLPFSVRLQKEVQHGLEESKDSGPPSAETRSLSNP